MDLENLGTSKAPDNNHAAELQSRDEILHKLVGLLRSYGLELPTTVPELETALKSVADMSARAGDSSVKPLSPGALAAATEPVRRLITHGSAIWKGFDVDIETRFKQLNEELPSNSGTAVTYKNLTYEVTRSSDKSSEPTVGDMILAAGGGLLCVPLIKRIVNGPVAKDSRVVVRDASGVFKQGELSLVIGPPGCGKSSLLKLLAGLIRKDSSHKVKGDMLYKGDPAKTGRDAKFSLPKVAAYVQQVDRHVALLTVEETLTFAFDSMEGGNHGTWIHHSEKTDHQKELLAWMDERKGKVQIIMRVLGLSAQKDTIVGDVFTRGVSGGERRRVTLGEMLAGSQDVFLMDSISNGLDSSTTYDIVDTLRKAAKTFNKTIVIALLQPPPEVYEMFDKVVVLASGGRIVYQGNREDVLPYFRSIGFQCPQRKDEADFVVEVTTDQGRFYEIEGHIEEGRGAPPPRTPAQFETLWRQSPGYAQVEADVQAEINGNSSSAQRGTDGSTVAATNSGGGKWPPNQVLLHARPWLYHMKTCLKKHWLLSKRDMAYTKQHLGLALFMGLVMGSIFLTLPLEEVNAKFGVLFFALLYLGLGGMAQLPAAIESRNVFYKQHAQGFYPASADTIAQVLVQAIITIAETIIFAPILYFMCGLSLDGGAGRFFIFLAILVVVNLNLAAYFRSIAAIMPNFSLAQLIAGITLVFIVLFCGFLVPEPDIPGVWIWIFWLNPLSWAFRAVVLNEFLSPKYKNACAVPLTPGTTECPQSLSTAVLASYGFRTEAAYIWGGILFILCMWVLTCFGTGAVLNFIRWDASDNAPIFAELDDAFDDSQAVSTTTAANTAVNAAAASVAVAQAPLSPAHEHTAGTGPSNNNKQITLDGVVNDGSHDTSSSIRSSGTIAPGTSSSDDNRPMRQTSSVQRRASRYESDAVQTKAECEADVARVTRQRMRSKSTSKTDPFTTFVPVTLAFRHIGYSVPHPSGDGMLELLKDVNGFAKPGTMTALMGSSGAGKTTLLDVLAGRKTGGEVHGAITLNGHPKDVKTFARLAGYVEQVDVHSPVVTVREAVDFSATMRLQETEWPPERRSEFVDEILEILELTSIKDRLIGSDETGGLATEQRKRVTIAVEMAANPSVLFLDEPTTGLDARSAQVVMRAIRKVAATNRSVICTIHQPSTYLFEMFDSLLLLKKGGETCYFGELGTHSCKLIEYMSSIPGTQPIRDNANPATWMLEQLGAGTSGRVNSQMFADWYNNSEKKRATDEELDQSLTVIASGSQPLSFPTKYAASASTQRNAHVKRAYKQYWRSPNYNFARIMTVIIQALVFGSSFVNFEPQNVAQMSSIFGVTFMVVIFVGVTYFQSSIPFTSMERAVFYREQAARMYDVKAYSLSYFLAEIPYILFNTLLFVSIFYFMANLEASADKFFWFWLFFMLNTAVMVFLGHAFTALLESVKSAQSFGSLLSSFFSLFAGFLISPGAIPNYWIWAYYLCPLHYTLEGLLSTQFHDDDREIIALDGTSTTTVSEYFNEFFEGKYEYANRWYDVLALVLFMGVARLMFFYAAAHVRHEKR